MPSKTLMGIWSFLDICLLAAGGIAVAFSVIFRAPDLLKNMVFSDAFLTGGLVVGIFLLATFLVSIGAIIQRNHVTIGLVILNWFLVMDGIVIITVGSMIWFFTLTIRNNLRPLYANLTDANKIILQDRFKCCGYFNASDLAVLGGEHCTSQTVLDQLNADNKTLSNFCVTPVTAFADMSLNNTFTTIYGFMAIVLALFLASACVINKRLESERFKKIDAKRGGRGFV